MTQALSQNGFKGPSARKERWHSDVQVQRKRSRAVAPNEPTASLIIPVRNEARNIDSVLDQIPEDVDEIILVDGNSTDATLITVRSYYPDIRVVPEEGVGKGNALRTGFCAATGDIIVMTDADGSMAPQEIRHYLHFLRNGYDSVKGSRFIVGGGSLDITAFRGRGNRFLLGVFNILYDTTLTDLCYGFWAFHFAVSASGFEIEAEMTVRAMQAGLRTAEVPRLEMPRRTGKSNLHAIRDDIRVLKIVMQHKQTGKWRRLVQALPNDRSSTAYASDAMSTRLITEDDLPVGRTEIELSAPPKRLVIAEPSTGPRKILALVRMHTYPLGIVILDGHVDRSWATHAPTVWSQMRDEVDAHLATDVVPPVDAADLYSRATHPVIRCRRRRAKVLSSAPHITVVVVATRTHAVRLRTCLYALLNLKYPRYDVVVVDSDRGTAETAELVARFPESVRHVRVYDRGLAKAYHRGLAETRDEIVAFVDDDVIVDRHWLTGIAEGFVAAPRVGCVTGPILPDQLETPAQLQCERHGLLDNEFRLRIFDPVGQPPEHPQLAISDERVGSRANMAFDLTILRGLGGFDAAIGAETPSRSGDDLAWIFRAVRGHRVVYQPAAIVWHRCRGNMAAPRDAVADTTSPTVQCAQPLGDYR